MSATARFLSALLVGLLAGSTSLWADPPSAEEEARDDGADAVVDFMPRMLDLYEQMQAHANPPREEGPERVLYRAWKADIKPRSRGLASKAKELTRESLWEMDEDAGAAVRVKPKHWGSALRRMTSLYTALGAAHKNYGKVTISPERAILLWDRKYPEPRLSGLTPAGIHLVRLRRQLVYLHGQGLPIPSWLIREIERYVILQSEEYELRREAHRRWVEDRRAAHLAIRARYAETRVLVENQRDILSDQMTALRVLMGDMQAVEERRLRAFADGYPDGDPVHAAAKRYLKKMASARKRGIRFSDARTSRYGLLVRQKWMVPRSHLLGAFKSADRRAAEAVAPAADDADPDK